MKAAAIVIAAGAALMGCAPRPVCRIEDGVEICQRRPECRHLHDGHFIACPERP